MEQHEKYARFKEERERTGHKRPLGEGVLIFDEVKVISKVLWNSRSQEIYGLAMTNEDMCSLYDIFEHMDDNATDRTEHILQFVWRDMTAQFDIIGPHYTSAVTLDAKFTVACVRDALRLFHCYGFKSSGLVCDGASTNLAMIKHLMCKPSACTVNLGQIVTMFLFASTIPIGAAKCSFSLCALHTS